MTPTMLPDDIANQLEGLRRSGDEWVAKCLVHDDHIASLTLRMVDDKLLVKCHAGCEQRTVLDALGYRTPHPVSEGEWTRHGEAVAVYDYRDERGQMLYQVLRTADKQFLQRRPEPLAKSGWKWSVKDVRRLLYRLPELIAAIAEGKEVCIAEGEKDVEALIAHGHVATCNSGGAGKWLPEFSAFFAGAAVTLFVDKDKPGRDHARSIAAQLAGIAASVTLVEAADPYKDIAAHLSAGLSISEVVPACMTGVEHADSDQHGGVAEPLYVDIGALLAGGLPDAPVPTVLARADDVSLFYAGQVNMLFGEPETGKTWIALAAMAEVLSVGETGLVVDLDHNGAGSTVARLLALGVSEEILVNDAVFRYAEPEERSQLQNIVRDVKTWNPGVVIVDSIGELMPLLGLGSNSPDEFTLAHAAVLKPMAIAGATVIAIDHVAKNPTSRSQGPTGTAAKKRAVGGTSIRVELVETFVPGRGGSARLRIHKDRHGGLRRHCPSQGAAEPTVGIFRLTDHGGALSYEITTADTAQSVESEPAVRLAADVAALKVLDPPPMSQRDVQDRLSWGGTRAADALRAYRQPCSGSAPEEQGADGDDDDPRSATPVSGSAEQAEPSELVDRERYVPAPRQALGKDLTLSGDTPAEEAVMDRADVQVDLLAVEAENVGDGEDELVDNPAGLKADAPGSGAEHDEAVVGISELPVHQLIPTTVEPDPGDVEPGRSSPGDSDLGDLANRQQIPVSVDASTDRSGEFGPCGHEWWWITTDTGRCGKCILEDIAARRESAVAS